MHTAFRHFLAPLILISACARTDPRTGVEPERAARVASMGLTYGDCAEARRRAAARPDLPVDRLPAPISMKPAPLARPPATALRKDGSAEVKIDVLIDTLGRADMRTFRVVKSSNAWLTENVRGVIAKWTFTPAQLAGCTVPRVYHFMASRTAQRD
jgi:hypothetical protein